MILNNLATKFSLVAVFSLFTLLVTCHTASAAIFTLIDDNSTASFETDNSASPSNQNGWTVDGTDQVFEQAFYFRTGSTAETSLHSLPIGAEGAFDTNFDGDFDTLFTRYDAADFEASVRYVLAGGSAGSGESSLGEQITIRNTSATTLNFDFFQYVDFDLNSSEFNDYAQFANVNAVQQWDVGAVLSEVVVTPAATHREIASFPATLDSLTDGLPTTLSDTPALSTVVGPDDVTWAFQWTFALAPGSTYQITKAKEISALPPVPEPSAVAMVGMIALAAVRRRRVA